MTDPIKLGIQVTALGSLAQAISAKSPFGAAASNFQRGVDVRDIPARGADAAVDLGNNPPWVGGVVIAS